MDGIVNGPGQGERLTNETRDLRIKASLPELDVTESEVEPGFNVGSHLHKRHADSFYVLEGELEFLVGDETVRAGPGTFVSVPPGVIHAFTNRGPNRARYLNIHAPACGFIEYLRALDRGEKVNPEDHDIWDV
jgi:mannose-6-phosphate isomerase-like protein (cupin superfamily)